MANQLIDMTGKRFGRLTVLRRAEKKSDCGAYWLCRCDCGSVKEVLGTHLRDNTTLSCGCYHKDNIASIQRRIKTTHGMSDTPVYRRWLAMRYRCYDPHHRMYYRYGGRGITVCDEWRNNFKAFYVWAEENGFKSTLTLDRINGNVGYSPDNCRWVNRAEQYLNKETKRDANGRFTI